LPITGTYLIDTRAGQSFDFPSGATGTYTITLDAIACTYSLSSSSASISASGSQNNSINVIKGNTACPFIATKNVPWITVSTVDNGNNNGTINYSVAENTTTSARSGTISIGNQTFTVNQAAPATCTSNPSAINVIDYGQTITSTLSTDSCRFLSFPGADQSAGKCHSICQWRQCFAEPSSSCFSITFYFTDNRNLQHQSFE
jgi:hypothetical protein